MSEDVFGEMVQFLQSIGPNILPQHLENVIIQANNVWLRLENSSNTKLWPSTWLGHLVRVTC